MKLVIEINLDNAAFSMAPDKGAAEVARMLGDVCKELEQCGELYPECGEPMMDVNGNTVGEWVVKEEPGDEPAEDEPQPEDSDEDLPHDSEPDESMDGDHDSAMRDAGFGTDEDYGGVRDDEG